MRYTVKEEGISLLDFVCSILPDGYSKKEIKRRIEANCCKLNGRLERKASTLLALHDRVEWDDSFYKKEEAYDSSRILYEDHEILIYNKPSGVSSDEAGIIELLKPHGRFLLVHRLDKETSGVLVLAKNSRSEKLLLEMFKMRKIKKSYLAISLRVPKHKTGIIENYLGKKGSLDGQAVYGAVLPAQGKFAKTEWTIKKALKNAALILCSPETGRTHQLRVHLSEMGHPILGDYRYGKESSLHCRLMLHAYCLEFLHPTTEMPIKIIAPIPKDFQDVIKLLS